MTGGSAGAGALSAEAKSKATGDIPDNQHFLKFTNSAAGYRMVYPEGWTQRGSGSDVTFVNNNNIIHVVIAKRGAPSAAEMQAELTKLKRGNSTLIFTAPTSIQLNAGNAVKATYRTFSAPNAVTGKRVELIVDRYELAAGGKRATIDLATAKGVDNVDAYRKIANSFHWR